MFIFFTREKAEAKAKAKAEAEAEAEAEAKEKEKAKAKDGVNIMQPCAFHFPDVWYDDTILFQYAALKGKVAANFIRKNYSNKSTANYRIVIEPIQFVS
jgi:membrane protein involved in colicin uptake